MKFPESFIPDKLDDRVELYLNKIGIDDQGLAIATGVQKSTYHEGYIYVWEPSMREPKFIRKRDSLVLDLCYFKNKLYDCGPYKRIYDTLNDQEHVNSFVSILAMKGYKKRLVHSQFNKIYMGKSELRRRKGWVYALEEHDNKLYDAGEYDAIYTTMGDGLVTKREGRVRALCSHKGELYDAGDYGKVYNTLTGERVADRFSGEIYTLCSFKNLLLEGGTSGLITNAFTDEPFFDFGNCMVTALETVPASLVKELMKIANT